MTVHCYHHTVIPLWIYRIPSELRSQAGLGSPSTVVGDHTGIVSAVCFFIFCKKHVSHIEKQTEKPSFLCKKSFGVQRTNKKILHKKDKPKKTTSLF